jgi:hypothetical protein
MRVEIAMPAASSRDELMRLPVDNCCIDTCWLRSVALNAACENKALTLVLITAILFLLTYFSQSFKVLMQVLCHLLQIKFACTWTIFFFS